MKHGFATLYVAPALVWLVAPGLPAQGRVLVRAKKAWLEPKQTLDLPSLLLVGGKVQQVGHRTKPGDRVDFADQAETTLTFADGVLTAGFVDAHAALGPASERGEAVEAFTPELRMSEAFDPFDPVFERLVAAGVTAVALAPDDRNLAGGRAAFFKPAKLSLARPEAAYQKLSLTRAMRQHERRPTSLMGAVDYLGERFEVLARRAAAPASPEGPAASAALASLSEIARGARVGIACQTADEIHAALDLAERYRLSAFLIHATDAARCIERLRGADATLVLAPLAPASPRKARELPRLLERAGIAFAFAGETASKTGIPALQQSLDLALRCGVSKAGALAAVTTIPARVLGRGAEIGSIVRGRDADIVVWSGEPFDLRSRVLLVLRGGKVVYRRPKEGSEK